MAATPYVLPDTYFYLDTYGANQYAINTGAEIAMPQLVNASVGTVFDLWVKDVWLNGQGAQEVTPGVGRGQVNQTRFIPSLKIEEQIQSAALPSDSNAPGAVPSIMYKVLKPGAFPIDDHIAFVRFLPIEKATKIVWTIKLTPSAKGNEVFADPAAVGPFLKNAVTNALAKLATDAVAAAL